MYDGALKTEPLGAVKRAEREREMVAIVMSKRTTPEIVVGAGKGKERRRYFL